MEPLSPLDLVKGEDFESLNKILLAMLNDENLELKTEIRNPLAVTQLVLLGKWLKLEGFEDCEKLINAFVLEYRTNMVSNNRMSREEVTTCIAERIKREPTVGEKLVGKQ